MADVHYLLSDLYIGGDEQLERVDFLPEPLAFLRDIEATDEDAELIIDGDAFGLWELTTVEGRLVVNTGTWLKRLHRQAAVLGVLPPVFYSSYRLNYFRLAPADDGSVVVDYEVIDQPDPREETLLERLLSRRPPPPEPIPDRTVVDPDDEVETMDDEVETTGHRSDEG